MQTQSYHVELSRANKMASTFDIQMKSVVDKFIAAGFSSRFNHSKMENFNDVK